MLDVLNPREEPMKHLAKTLNICSNKLFRCLNNNLMVNIRMTLFYELHSQFIQFLEVITCISNLEWFPTHPLDNFFNVINILLLFCFRICIIISQITTSIPVFCQSKINKHSLNNN
ncbi:hypothetical protein V8G54_029403 [Vigna mungo]|uniref:Uncharacterized protein n=1 Tax=Vigna mungo TaxID=3915 RepID=A0AAQ3MU55_VIGMU